MSDSCDPMDYSLPGSSVHGISQAGRREYWSGLPFLSPGDLPDPGIEPRFPALQANSLPLSYQESPGCHDKQSFVLLSFIVCLLLVFLFVFFLGGMGCTM